MDVIQAFQRESRELAWEGEALELLPRVTRRCSADGERNFVTAFALDEDSAEDEIRAQVDHFGALGREFEWKVFSWDEPSNLRERLAAAGFAVGQREALVIYDLRQGLEPFGGDFRCEVHRIVTVEELTDFRDVAQEAFGNDYASMVRELAEAIAVGRRGHDVYLARVDGFPASAARLYTNPQSQFAGLYGGGTVPKYRGMGCYRALVAARAHDAAEMGLRYLQVDAMPTSLPILLRLGFQHVADSWPCTWKPGN